MLLTTSEMWLLLLLLMFLLPLLFWLQRRGWQLVWALNGWRGIAMQPIFWFLLMSYLDPSRVLEAIQRLRKYFQRPLAIIVFSRVLVYVDDPAGIECVLNAPECVDKPFMSDGFFANRGLLHATGQRWRARRRQLNPCFNQAILLSFFDTFNGVGNRLQQQFALDALGDAVNFLQIEDLISRAVLEVACDTTMGAATDFTRRDERGIARAYKKLMEVSALKVIKPWLQNDLLFRCLDGANYAAHRRHLLAVEGFVAQIVREKLEERHKMQQQQGPQQKQLSSPSHQEHDIPTGAVGRRIFIEQLFHLADTGELTLQEVLDEANSMVMVSFETVSNSLIMALLCLAAHPAAQRQLRCEIERVLPTAGDVAALLAAQLQQLKYLDMVVNESMRLLATIPLTLRHCGGEFRLRAGGLKASSGDGGVLVPPNALILLDLFNMQRDSEFWGTHAQRFDPERHFGGKEGEAAEGDVKRHAYAFVPFLKGVRWCIGSRYSILLMKVLLTKLIYHFEFSTETRLQELRYVEGISLKLKHSERIHFVVRQVARGRGEGVATKDRGE